MLTYVANGDILNSYCNDMPIANFLLALRVPFSGYFNRFKAHEKNPYNHIHVELFYISFLSCFLKKVHPSYIKLQDEPIFRKV